MKHSSWLLATTALGLVLAGSAQAQSDQSLGTMLETLKAQVALQQQQIEALSKQLTTPRKEAAEAKSVPSSKKGSAESRPASSSSLEKRVATIEKKEETKPTVEVTPDKGISIATADKQYSAQIGAYAQADSRTYFEDNKSVLGTTTNTFLIRSLMPSVTAKMTDYFNAYIAADFGGGTVRLSDAYVDLHPMPKSNYVNLRVGQFTAPVGMERGLSSQGLPLVERSLATNLVPSRDQGAMLYGQIVPNVIEYQAGLFNGVADLVTGNGQTGNDKDMDGRVFVTPFGASDNMPLLKGLGAGVAGSYGGRHGSTTTTQLPTGYVSIAQRSVFAYSAGTFASGDDWRLNPQASYSNGPFKLMGEYVLEGQDVENGANKKALQHQAWQTTASYVLTGEKPASNGVNPAHNFDPFAGQWGAFEVVGRLSELRLDSNTFPTYATATTAVKGANESSLGVNWYFNPSVKLDMQYSNTAFEGGSTTGNREDENVLLSRVQFRY